MDNKKAMLQKALIPIAIRAVLFILVLVFKEELGKNLSMIIIAALVSWSIYDFIKKRKTMKSKS